MGHETYGRLMHNYFSAEAKETATSAGSKEPIDFDFHWGDEGRTLLSKIDCRIGQLKLPGTWLRRNELDFARYRAEMAYARRARRLAERLIYQQTDKPYNVLHFHTQVNALASLKLMRHLPTIITADMTAELFVTTGGTDPAFRWTHAPSVARERRVFTAASHVVFWSQWAFDSFVRDLGMPPEKGTVIPPGIDLSAFDAETWLRARHESAAEKRLVRLLFVGGDFRRKGGYDLLAAFRQANLVGRAELHLVTNEPISPEPGSIFLHHNIRAYTPEWLALFRDADAFVFPTHYDALGIAVMEAAGAGLPVVSTHINGIPELVVNEETGFLVPVGDVNALGFRMDQLVTNAELRARMGAASLALARERFALPTNFERLANVFRSAAMRLAGR